MKRFTLFLTFFLVGLTAYSTEEVFGSREIAPGLVLTTVEDRYIIEYTVPQFEEVI